MCIKFNIRIFCCKCLTHSASFACARTDLLGYGSGTFCFVLFLVFFPGSNPDVRHWKKKSPCSSLEHYLHSFPCSSATSVSIPCVCARCTHPVCVPRGTQTGTCGCRLGPALFLGFPSAFLARNSRTEGTLPSFESVRRGESSQAWEIFLSPLHVACFYALTCPSSLAGSR